MCMGSWDGLTIAYVHVCVQGKRVALRQPRGANTYTRARDPEPSANTSKLYYLAQARHQSCARRPGCRAAVQPHARSWQ